MIVTLGCCLVRYLKAFSLAIRVVNVVWLPLVDFCLVGYLRVFSPANWLWCDRIPVEFCYAMFLKGFLLVELW